MKYGVKVNQRGQLILFHVVLTTMLVGCGSSESDKPVANAPKANGPISNTTVATGQPTASHANALSTTMGDVSREIAAQAQAAAAQQEKAIAARAAENRAHEAFKAKENDKNRAIEKIESVMPLLLTGVLGKTMMFMALPDSAKCENYKSTTEKLSDVDQIYKHQQKSSANRSQVPASSRSPA